ncbi:hypothetical protein A2U01_0082183, partial [Trifolium medium]|nr:hypothetical protein [Trifolium medium]
MGGRVLGYGTYHVLTHLTSTELYSHCELVRNKLVPLK